MNIFAYNSLCWGVHNQEPFVESYWVPPLPMAGKIEIPVKETLGTLDLFFHLSQWQWPRCWIKFFTEKMCISSLWVRCKEQLLGAASIFDGKWIDMRIQAPLFCALAPCSWCSVSGPDSAIPRRVGQWSCPRWHRWGRLHWPDRRLQFRPQGKMSDQPVYVNAKIQHNSPISDEYQTQ